jgi:hypothetical protein
MNITCKCGHEADFDEFRRTPVTGELPAGEYQCPKCRRAWTLRMVTPCTVGWSGMILPGKSAVVEIPARL